MGAIFTQASNLYLRKKYFQSLMIPEYLSLMYKATRNGFHRARGNKKIGRKSAAPI